jgi:hypothetical protein
LFLFLDRICFVFIGGECGWKRNDTIWGPHRDAHKHLLFYYYYIRLEDFEKKTRHVGERGVWGRKWISLLAFTFVLRSTCEMCVWEMRARSMEGESGGLEGWRRVERDFSNCFGGGWWSWTRIVNFWK